MGGTSPQAVTQLLIQWSNGNRQALDKLVPLVYRELQRLARSYLRRRPNQSIQTNSLINEAFIRLIDQDQIRWENRTHFFGIAARTMRNVLVDHARKRHAQKRGGRGAVRVTFDDAIMPPNQRKDLDLIALDDALTSLAELDPKLSQLVELRFFGGLTIEESAEVLGVSPATVKRGWATAKIWLVREIDHGKSHES